MCSAIGIIEFVTCPHRPHSNFEKYFDPQILSGRPLPIISHSENDMTVLDQTETTKMRQNAIYFCIVSFKSYIKE